MAPASFRLSAAAFTSCAFLACAARTNTPVTQVSAPEPNLGVSTPAHGTSETAETFADLLRAAGTREGAGDSDATHCVFERDTRGLHTVGAVSPALRPLPQPASDLDTTLAHNITLNVLTPFGRYGAATGGLTLASFTYAPPSREACALIITDQGIALRGTAANVPMRDKLSLPAAVDAVAALMPVTVFVSAEAPVPTLALADLLQALEARHVPAALAVSLAPDTHLPELAAGARADTCPSGLPATGDPEGALDATALTPALGQLRMRAVDCLASADPRGAAGGRLRLLMRVAGSGMLSEACIDEDEIGDARLRACILQQAHKLRFPAPAPSGSVDLALPLKLVPSFAPAPPLLCGAPPAP